MMLRFLLILCVFLSSSTTSTLQDKEALFDKLVNGYHRHVRPGNNQSIPMEINLGFFMLSLKEFEEKLGKFSIVGFFTITWTDERLSWNPRNYNGTDFTHLPVDLVWVPNMILANAYEGTPSLKLPEAVMELTYNGVAFWTPGNVFEVSCVADIAFYPFDVHTCSTLFTMWGYTVRDVTFKLSPNDLDYTMYTPNGKWNITSSVVKTEVHNSVPFIAFDFVFARYSHYEIINTVLPVILLEVLHVIVFLIPADSGERIGYATTILLAITVYMTIVSDRLPDVSYPNISYLSYFFLSDVIFGFILIVCVVQGLRLQHVSCIKRGSKCYGTHCSNSSKITPSDHHGNVCVSVEPTQESPDSHTEIMTKHGCCLAIKACKDVGNTFDKCCVVTFILVQFVKIVLLFANITKNHM